MEPENDGLPNPHGHDFPCSKLPYIQDKSSAWCHIMTLDEKTHAADAQDQKVFAITGTFSVFAYLSGSPRNTSQNLPPEI